MSKLSRGIGAAILCLGMLFSASILMAMQDQPMKSEKEAQKKEKTKGDTTTISGTVTAVTDSGITIVDAEKAEHTLAVTSETKVMKGGKDAVLADVKANDVVTIEAKKGAGDAWLALKIAVS
jgi:preprotein translocase subunit YajC